MTEVWARIAQDEDSVLDEVTSLVHELDDDDARAPFELASAHDFLGHEATAIPLYERALALGLDPGRRVQAVVQFGEQPAQRWAAGRSGRVART